jgi:hypothetical protein
MLCADNWRCSARCKPSFHFRKIPHNAPWRQSEALREISTLLHLVDRAIGERDHFAQLMTPDGFLDRRLVQGGHLTLHR